MKCLNSLLQHEPKNAHAYVEQAWIWQRWPGEKLDNKNTWSSTTFFQGNPDKTVEAYRKALAIDPECFEARLGLANIRIEEKDIPEAKQHFDSLFKRQPKNPDVLLGLAQCDVLMGDRATARKRLDDLLAQHPRFLAALRERGKLEGEPAQAEKWFRKALAVNPSDLPTIYSLIVCLNQMGKREEAGQIKKKYEKIAKDLRGLAEIVRKIESKPHDPLLRSEAGTIFLRLGHDQEGIAWLYSALELEPHNLGAHEVLADYFDRVSQKEKAAHHRKLAEEKK